MSNQNGESEVLTTAIAIAQYLPLLLDGIKTGAEIAARIQAGDHTAEEAAKDWLGITQKVDAAIREWKASEADSDDTRPA